MCLRSSNGRCCPLTTVEFALVHGDGVEPTSSRFVPGSSAETRVGLERQQARVRNTQLTWLTAAVPQHALAYAFLVP